MFAIREARIAVVGLGYVGDAGSRVRQALSDHRAGHEGVTYQGIRGEEVTTREVDQKK